MGGPQSSDASAMAETLEQGVAAHRAGRLEDAAALYRKVLGVTPGHPDALRLLGLAVLDLGMVGPAVDLLKAAASIANSGLFWADLGRVFGRLKRFDEAEQALRKAISLTPEEPSFLWDLGLLLRQSGQLEAAEAIFAQVYRLNPDHPHAAELLAQTLIDQGKPTQALAVLTPYLARFPGQIRAHVLAGHCSLQCSALEAAARSFERALAFSPCDPVPLGNLSLIRQLQGRIDSAISLNDQARGSDPLRVDLVSNRLMAAQYHPQASAENLYSLHRDLAPLLERWAEREIPAAVDPTFARHDKNPQRPLRIGYLSPDFARHPVGHFLTAVLPHHDPAQVQVVAYSDRVIEDDFSDRLRVSPALRWQSVRHDSGPALAQRIRGDQIDILIDLAGHTANNRLPVIAARLAPIQLTWAGYVGTTGLTAMDGLIADRYHIPSGEEKFYSEAVLRMPKGYVPYAPPPYLPDVAASPAAARGMVSFGCTNGLAKINSAVAALWAQILAQVANSRLVIKTDALSDRATAQAVAHMIGTAFEAQGIAPNRLVLAGRSSHRDHLAFYGEIDILLDPFPYSGGLTTLESLWMGVPVVTMPGTTFASRHSTSHLSVAGLAELCVAESPEDYGQKAISLARDSALLASLRGTLRHSMEASPIADGASFTRDLEALYRQAWQDWVMHGRIHKGAEST
jgi:predicted O-linked N-acetylglucosamine transferase (SPINDLY family)